MCRTHACARDGAGAHARADVPRTGCAHARPRSSCWFRLPLLACLSGLTTDRLALVAHALALVRVGPAQPAQIGGNLADLLLVDPRDRETRRRLDRKRHTFRGCHDDRVT